VNRSTLPALTPDFSKPVPTNDNARLTTTINFLRKQLTNERQTHSSVLAVMTRHISTLEQQVSDLRQLYFEKIALKAGQQ
jgi:hypothetical protein